MLQSITCLPLRIHYQPHFIQVQWLYFCRTVPVNIVLCFSLSQMWYVVLHGTEINTFNYKYYNFDTSIRDK